MSKKELSSLFMIFIIYRTFWYARDKLTFKKTRNTVLIKKCGNYERFSRCSEFSSQLLIFIKNLNAKNPLLSSILKHCQYPSNPSESFLPSKQSFAAILSVWSRFNANWNRRVTGNGALCLKKSRKNRQNVEPSVRRRNSCHWRISADGYVSNVWIEMVGKRCNAQSSSQSDGIYIVLGLLSHPKRF